jgi:glycosyltransferase involved in cell wall biosynthesis/Flp pilus assembly pilin Flp
LPPISATDPCVTIVVSPRDRFSLAVAALEDLISTTAFPFELIYIDAGSPAKIARQLERLVLSQRGIYVRVNGFLTPNEARNRGQRLATTPFVVFLDNDVFVSPDWLARLVETAIETGADVVAPLTCQGLPLHTEIHQAGGEFAPSLEQFLSGDQTSWSVTDIHLGQGAKVGETRLQRSKIQCCEFHCTLVRRDVFARFGELDEGLLATKEHIDFSMTVWNGGGQILLDPRSIVTFRHPDKVNPVKLMDWPFFILRWSPEWQRSSLKHFQNKWGRGADPYFKQRETILTWRLSEGIVKPIVRALPPFLQRHRVMLFANAILLPMLANLGARLATRHRKSKRPLRELTHRATIHNLMTDIHGTNAVEASIQIGFISAAILGLSNVIGVQINDVLGQLSEVLWPYHKA